MEGVNICINCCLCVLVSDKQYDLRGQGQDQMKFILWLIVQTLLTFFDGVFILGIMVAYDVMMTTNLLDRQYEIGVKCQG